MPVAEQNIETTNAMPAKISLLGQVFGKLIVIADAPSRGKRTMAICRCDCGNEVTVSNNSLQRGNTKSCGCLKHDRAANWIHGLQKTPTYNSWASMIQRCTNPNNPNFKDYGARGVRVCDSWRVFANFHLDMGLPPDRHTLERVNNSGNYEPGNCIWATRRTQSYNKRNNLILTVNGKTGCLAELAAHFGVRYMTAWKRLRRGKPIEQVFASAQSTQ